VVVVVKVSDRGRVDGGEVCRSVSIPAHEQVTRGISLRKGIRGRVIFDLVERKWSTTRLGLLVVSKVGWSVVGCEVFLRERFERKEMRFGLREGGGGVVD
jgi:hypothetical protein